MHASGLGAGIASLAPERDRTKRGAPSSTWRIYVGVSISLTTTRRLEKPGQQSHDRGFHPQHPTPK